MSQPCTAEAVERFKDGVARPRPLGLKMVGAANAGNAGAHDQDVDMIGRVGLRGQGPVWRPNLRSGTSDAFSDI